MCGIAGWAAFDRDLTHERETLAAMTETMAQRGPDEEGLWLSEHAAIGHRRLAVIDIEGGKQPMVDRTGQVVLTYSGEVYNYRELRQDLRARGHEFRTESDTEVVLNAYLEWGSAMVTRLNGMYAFAIWDGRSEELLLVRDRLGIKPLFYHLLDQGIMFGSEPKAILANPLADRHLDRTGLAGFMVASPPPGRTLFSEVRELVAGHYLLLSRDGAETVQYWAVQSWPHEDDEPTTVARVRELLDDTVSRQLVSDVPLCVLLSGGVDSSALTGLAQRAVSQASPGERIRSFSVDFAGYAENFKPDYNRDTPDRPYAHEAVRYVGSVHQDIMLETTELSAPATRDAALRAWDLPYHLGDMDLSLYLLFKAIREHSTVALSGEGADEVFGGYPWIHDQAAIDLPVFPWLAPAINSGEAPMFSIFKPELVEDLGVIQYLLDHYNDTLAAVPLLEGEEGKEKRMREVMYMHLTRWLRFLLDRKDRMSMASGLEVRVPFCDHRLVEYVFNAPWAMKTSDGREKSLLRKAVEDVVPQACLDRKKAGFPATQDSEYDMVLKTELGRIVDDPDQPVYELLDLDAARGAAEEPVKEATSSYPRLRLESAVRMNMWLKEYDVELGAIPA